MSPKAYSHCIIGPQGSGKGTQAELLSAYLSLPHISTGELYREQIRQKTNLGKLAQACFDEGKLVPDDVTNKMVKDTLRGKEFFKGVILDGYPRNNIQAQYLATIIKKYIVIYINVSDEEVIKRLGGRRICAKGHTYHVEFNPSKKERVCDIDGLSILPRGDDTEELIKKRLNNYHTLTEPLLTFYRKKNVLLTINGEQSIGDVFHEIKEQLNRYDRLQNRG